MPPQLKTKQTFVENDSQRKCRGLISRKISLNLSCFPGTSAKKMIYNCYSLIPIGWWQLVWRWTKCYDWYFPRNLRGNDSQRKCRFAFPEKQRRRNFASRRKRKWPTDRRKRKSQIQFPGEWSNLVKKTNLKYFHPLKASTSQTFQYLTHLTWLIHTSCLHSKWNLYPKIQFLA